MAALERMNLNIPAATRATIQRLAKATDRKEAEVARELLVHAVEQAEREEFFREMEANITPAARRRLAAISHALEGLRGRKG
jgi:hypothetical protein